MLSNYGLTFPVQASSFAAQIDRGIGILHVAMVLIFVAWGIFFTYLLIKYRAREGGKADRSHVSLQVSIAPDIAVLSFEILLVVFYAVPTWSKIKMNFPDKADALNIEVVAEQFNWNVRYPGPDGTFGKVDAKLIDFANPLGIDPTDPAGLDDVVTVNEMRLPVDKTVLVALSSKDVIHNFFIPAFRIKQDATPGLKIPVWFKPTREGHYEITCAQLCGVGHAIMRADVHVESTEAFSQWLAAQKPRVVAKAGDSSEEW